MSRLSDELKEILKGQVGGARTFRALAKARGIDRWNEKMSQRYGTTGPGGIGSFNPKAMYVFEERPGPDLFSELEAEHAPQEIYVYWFDQSPLPERAWPVALEEILRLIKPPTVINRSESENAGATLRKAAKEIGFDLLEQTVNQRTLF